MKKKIMAPFIMGLMLAGTTIPAYAGTVNNVYLQLTETKGEDGSVPETDITEDSDQFDITNVSFSPDQESWYPGKKVTVTVDVDALDGYSFNKNKTNVRVNGGITKEVSKTIKSGQITYKFNYYPKVQLPAPSNIHFGNDDEDIGYSDYIAKWDKIPYAKYEVKIFKYNEDNDSWDSGETVTVTEPKIDLSQYATGNGAIRFEVRAVSKTDNNNSSVLSSKWVNSEDMEIESDLSNSVRGDFTNKNGNLTFSDNQNKAVSGWQYINGSWYYFDPENNNIAKKGFTSVNTVCYFFNDEGKMQTGWQLINGNWYYFTPENTKSLGAMRLGWYEVKPGVWYYFETRPGQQTPWGAMVSNAYTPDGYYIGASGAWTANSAS